MKMQRMESKPLITVALPLWEAGEIAWLCVESLCRQEVKEPWELIVCEEQTKNKFGLDRLEEYIPRLREAGMVDLNYVIQEEHVKLAHKWRKIADFMSESSRSYHMCAADNYYQKNMLQNGYNGISAGADWFSTYESHFYNIKTDILVRYFFKRYCGIEMAMSSEKAKLIKGANSTRGIDLFIYRTVKPEVRVWDDSGDGYYTVCTHGKNMISKNRGPMINNYKRPFYKTDTPLDDLLPKEIVERLKCLQLYYT